MMSKGRDPLAVVRWLALMTLLVGMVVGATFEVPRVGGGVAIAKEKGGGHGDSGNHGKGNKNDDGDDDDEGDGTTGGDEGDNRGKGNNGDENDKKDKKGQDEDEAAPEPVQVVVMQPDAGYRVTVGCHADAQLGQSTCVFAGVATAEGETIGGLAVSEGTVCASVLAGDFARSDGASSQEDTAPTSGTSDASWYAVGSGYRGPAFVSNVQPDVVTLVLAGTVTTGGAATYWLRTEIGVQAAAGPGLRCAPSNATGSAAKATGAIVVQGFACPFDAAATDPASVDWFATCAQPEKATYELTALDGDNAGWQRSETADADGVLRAEDLAPGHYRLVQVDSDWCHAESDRVDDQGNVVVVAGERASVWIFDCAERAGATPSPVAK